MPATGSGKLICQSRFQSVSAFVACKQMGWDLGRAQASSERELTPDGNITRLNNVGQDCTGNGEGGARLRAG